MILSITSARFSKEYMYFNFSSLKVIDKIVSNHHTANGILISFSNTVDDFIVKIEGTEHSPITSGGLSALEKMKAINYYPVSDLRDVVKIHTNTHQSDPHYDTYTNTPSSISEALNSNWKVSFVRDESILYITNFVDVLEQKLALVTNSTPYSARSPMSDIIKHLKETNNLSVLLGAVLFFIDVQAKDIRLAIFDNSGNVSLYGGDLGGKTVPAEFLTHDLKDMRDSVIK